MEVERRKSKLLTTQLSVLSSKRRTTNEGHDSLIGLSVDALLSGELARPIKPQQQNTLTLLDIISNEESGAAYRGLAALNGTSKQKKKSSSTKSIKDRLKFRKASSSWSSSSSVPTSDLPSNHKKNRRNIEQISDPVLVDRPLLASLSLRSSMELLDDGQASDSKSKSYSSSDGEEEEENVNTTATEEKENQGKPESVIHTESDSLVDDRNVSEPDEGEKEEDEKIENEPGPLISEPMVEPEAPPVSLMALLEESGRRVDDDEDDDEEDDEDDEGTGVEYICTVCIVKHRRLAFVPCGHTFCRLCSKELWVSRGNCPLCTGYILEILDIF